MNSLYTDMKRAIFSKGFFAGIILQIIVLKNSGFKTDMYYLCIPVICTLPYSTAWLMDYQSGFVKQYLSRTGVFSYVFGKIVSCIVSGGLAEVAGCYIYFKFMDSKNTEVEYLLIFMSGMLWAGMSGMLAAMSGSRYLAYGGSFVVYHLLIMLGDRYFEWLYCLNPYEWISPVHTWVMEKQGVAIMLGGITIVIIMLYYCIVERKVSNI